MLETLKYHEVKKENASFRQYSAFKILHPLHIHRRNSLLVPLIPTALVK